MAARAGGSRAGSPAVGSARRIGEAARERDRVGDRCADHHGVRARRSKAGAHVLRAWRAALGEHRAVELLRPAAARARGRARPAPARRRCTRTAWWPPRARPACARGEAGLERSPRRRAAAGPSAPAAGMNSAGPWPPGASAAWRPPPRRPRPRAAISSTSVSSGVMYTSLPASSRFVRPMTGTSTASRMAPTSSAPSARMPTAPPCSAARASATMHGGVAAAGCRAVPAPTPRARRAAPRRRPRSRRAPEDAGLGRAAGGVRGQDGGAGERVAVRGRPRACPAGSRPPRARRARSAAAPASKTLPGVGHHRALVRREQPRQRRAGAVAPARARRARGSPARDGVTRAAPRRPHRLAKLGHRARGHRARRRCAAGSSLERRRSGATAASSSAARAARGRRRWRSAASRPARPIGEAAAAVSEQRAPAVHLGVGVAATGRRHRAGARGGHGARRSPSAPKQRGEAVAGDGHPVEPELLGEHAPARAGGRPRPRPRSPTGRSPAGGRGSGSGPRLATAATSSAPATSFAPAAEPRRSTPGARRSEGRAHRRARP